MPEISLSKTESKLETVSQIVEIFPGIFFDILLGMLIAILQYFDVFWMHFDAF